MIRPRSLRPAGPAVALLTAVALLAASGTVGAAAGASAGSALVVDGEADGDGAYATIRAAVDAAGAGDRIEVRPGTYAAAVTVAKNVTLVAPRGAVLDGSSLGDEAVAVTVPPGSAAEPVVAGLAIRDYYVGVDGRETTGAWRLRNVTVTNAVGGVVAGSSSGDWRIEQASIADARIAVDAADSSGDWTVGNATLANTADGAVKAQRSSGDWTLREVRIDGADVGVSAPDATGEWTLANVTVRRTAVLGVDASNAGGAWRVRDAVVAGSDGVGVYAPFTDGRWAIRGSAILDNSIDGTGDASGVDATDGEGESEGAATGNWWGDPRGIDGDDCRGALDCGDPLTSRPDDAGGDGYDGGNGPVARDRTEWPVSAADWPAFGGDAANAGLGDGTAGVAAPVERRWHALDGRAVDAAPAVANGTVYVGSNDGRVYAVDAATGAVRWRFETGAFVQSSPAVANGTVVVGTHSGRTYALDAATGSMRWEFDAGAGVTAGTTVANGTVYLGSQDDRVYALDLATGTLEWSFDAGSDVETVPAVVDGTAYVGTDGGSVYALDASDGDREWRHRAEGGVRGSPAVADGTVYVGTIAGAAVALDATDGSVRWRRETGGQVRASPAVDGSTAFVAGGDEAVYAIDAASGAVEWRTGLDGTAAAPVLVDGTLYVATQNRRLTALNATSGAREWSREVAGRAFSPATVANGTAYVPSDGLEAFGGSGRERRATIGEFVAENPARGVVRVRVDATDRLDPLRATLARDGERVATLNRTDFARGGNGSAARIEVAGNGTYTATLARAVGPDGTALANGRTDAVVVGSTGDAGNPTVDLGPDRTVATNATVRLRARTGGERDVTYAWTANASGALDAGAANATLDAAAVEPGAVVSVAVTVAAGNATATDRANVTVRNASVDEAVGTLAVRPGERVLRPGRRRPLSLVLRRPGTGLAAYDLRVTLGNATTARIVDVRVPASASDASIDYGPSNGSVEVAASAAGDRSGGTAALPTVVVAGRTPGRTRVRVGVDRVAGRSGERLPLRGIENGTVSVRSPPARVPGFDARPTDPDADGRYEDLTGDGAVTVADVQAMTVARDGPAVEGDPVAFDFNADGRSTVADLQALAATRRPGARTAADAGGADRG